METIVTKPCHPTRNYFKECGHFAPIHTRDLVWRFELQSRERMEWCFAHREQNSEMDRFGGIRSVIPSNEVWYRFQWFWRGSDWVLSDVSLGKGEECGLKQTKPTAVVYRPYSVSIIDKLVWFVAAKLWLLSELFREWPSPHCERIQIQTKVCLQSESEIFANQD